MSLSENHLLKTSNTLGYMFFAGFLIVALFSGLLVQIGSPDRFVALFMLTFIVSSYIFVGILGKTMGMNTFQIGDRMGRPISTALAIASGVVSSGIYILLAGEFYSSGTASFASYLGWFAGIGILLFAFSAFVARSKQATVAGLLQPADGNSWLSFFAMLVTLVCCLILVLLQFEFIAIVGEKFLYLSRDAAIKAAAISVGFCVLAGGLQSVTLIRQIAFPVILACFMIPLVWLSIRVSGVPVPQLATGFGALLPIADIDQQLVEAGLAEANELFDFTRDSADVGLVSYLSMFVCIACGLAAMPHLLQHFSALDTGRKARRTGYVSLILILVFLTAVPTVTAFVKLDLYTSLLGLKISDLETDAEWVFSLSGLGTVKLLMLCGELVSNVEQTIAACGQSAEYFLAASDITLNPDLLALASPALHGLPNLVTMLLAMGAMLALYTTLDGILLAMGLTMTNDGYRRLFRPKSPKSVRLFMTRVFILAALGGVTYVALNYTFDTALLFEASFALIAGSLFVPLVIRVWTKTAEPNVVLASMITGFATTALLIFFNDVGTDLILGSGDELKFLVPGSEREATRFAFGLCGMLVAILPLILHWIILKLSSKNQKGDLQDATA